MGNLIDKFAANSLTMMNLALGSAAIISITNQSYTLAALLILLAALMDTFDGKAARYFNSSSEIGKHLDSLSDLVSFGIAPSLLIFSQVNTEGLFIPLLLVYIVYNCCGAFRLARFNSMNITKYFQGLPITAAGMLLAICSLATLPDYKILSIVIMLLLSMLMVSNIKIPKL